MNLPAVGVASLAIVVAARVFRSLLPGGAAEGAFCAAITGAAIAAVLTTSPLRSEWSPRDLMVVSLSVLSVGWAAAGRVRERHAQLESLRRLAMDGWARLCGVGAVGGMLLLAPVDLEWHCPRYLPLVWLPFAIVAAVLAGGNQGADARPTLWFLLAPPAWIGAIQLARDSVVGNHYALPAGVLVVAIEAGDAVLVWSTRRRAWMARYSVEHSAPRRPGPGWIIGSAGFLAAAACLAVMDLATTPIAWFCLSVAMLVSFHRRGHAAFRVAGVFAIAFTIVSMALAWLPGRVPPHQAPVHPKAVLGLAAAALYFDWLRRFWGQQLLDGKPWTTAGRLIPAVGCGSVGAGYGAMAVAIAVLFGNRSSIEASPVVAVIGGLACVAAALRLLRPPCHVPADAVAFCAWPLGLIGAMLVAESAEIWWEGGAFRWLLPSLAGVVLAIRSARTARVTGTNAGMMSWWIGSAPTMAVLAAAAFSQWRTAFFVVAALLITGLSAWAGVRVARVERVGGSN